MQEALVLDFSEIPVSEAPLRIAVANAGGQP